MQTQLITWLDDKVVSPKPAGDELNLIYLIIAPSDTTLSNGNLTSASFCGYHDHGQYSATTTRDNLIGAPSRATRRQRRARRLSIQSVSVSVMSFTEAFPNPDGNGFYNQVDASDACEISDICEAAKNSDTIITVPYMTWQVEQYWSNLDAKYIFGPV